MKSFYAYLKHIFKKDFLVWILCKNTVEAEVGVLRAERLFNNKSHRHVSPSVHLGRLMLTSETTAATTDKVRGRKQNGKKMGFNLTSSASSWRECGLVEVWVDKPHSRPGCLLTTLHSRESRAVSPRPFY